MTRFKSKILHRVKLEFLFNVTDENSKELKQRVQEHINVMYSKMSEEDIKIALQTDFGVEMIGDVTEYE